MSESRCDEGVVTLIDVTRGNGSSHSELCGSRGWSGSNGMVVVVGNDDDGGLPAPVVGVLKKKKRMSHVLKLDIADEIMKTWV